MSPSDENALPSAAPGGQFLTTRWSLVAVAQEGDSPAAREALAELCRAYWYPLYAFIRRQGYRADQAQDLTQEFFARLLEKDYLRAVDPQKGRFRAFLLAACKHFLANERDRANAQKRGGGRPTVSIDRTEADGRYSRAPADTLSPDRLFERQWAIALLERVLNRLREEFQRSGRQRLFDVLKGALTGNPNALPYRELTGQLKMTEGAVRVAVHRLRQRYRELLREEIAATVDDPQQVEEEIRDLFNALAP